MKKKKINSSFSDYFNFSSRERKGATLLAFLLTIELIVLYWIRHSSHEISPAEQEMYSSYVKDLETLPVVTTPKENLRTVALFAFDPNKSSDSTFSCLGFSEKQIVSLRNYMSHGGKFRVKNDFKKMYCISPVQYSSLEPYLILPDSITKPERNNRLVKKKMQLINLASADSSALTTLRGIGPVLASRIVKYREKLGGFILTDQLKEVWGINDSLFNSILPEIVLKDSIPFRFIHLNSDSFLLFASHPYIKSKLASLICSYRKQHGHFSDAEELRNLPLVSDENFRKLAPYIRLD